MLPRWSRMAKMEGTGSIGNAQRKQRFLIWAPVEGVVVVGISEQGALTLSLPSGFDGRGLRAVPEDGGVVLALMEPGREV